MVQGAGHKTRTTGTFGSVDKRATGYRARYYHQGQQVPGRDLVPDQGAGPGLAGHRPERHHPQGVEGP